MRRSAIRRFPPGVIPSPSPPSLSPPTPRPISPDFPPSLPSSGGSPSSGPPTPPLPSPLPQTPPPSDASSGPVTPLPPPSPCGICLQGDVAPGGLTACGGGGCGHAYCTPCLAAHVRSRLADRAYPVPCPAGGCGVPLPFAVCAALLAQGVEATGDMGKVGAGVTAFLDATHIQTTLMGRVGWCANAVCGTPFEFVPPPWAGEAANTAASAAAAVHRANRSSERAAATAAAISAAAAAAAAYRVVCPLCAVATCVRCRSKGHPGLPCRRPLVLRPGDATGFHNDAIEEEDWDTGEGVEAGDRALAAAAHRAGWRSCPGCGALVERPLGSCAVGSHPSCGAAWCWTCGDRVDAGAGNSCACAAARPPSALPCAGWPGTAGGATGWTPTPPSERRSVPSLVPPVVVPQPTPAVGVGGWVAAVREGPMVRIPTSFSDLSSEALVSDVDADGGALKAATAEATAASAEAAAAADDAATAATVGGSTPRPAKEVAPSPPGWGFRGSRARVGRRPIAPAPAAPTRAAWRVRMQETGEAFPLVAAATAARVRQRRAEAAAAAAEVGWAGRADPSTAAVREAAPGTSPSWEGTQQGAEALWENLSPATVLDSWDGGRATATAAAAGLLSRRDDSGGIGGSSSSGSRGSPYWPRVNSVPPAYASGGRDLSVPPPLPADDRAADVANAQLATLRSTVALEAVGAKEASIASRLGAAVGALAAALRQLLLCQQQPAAARTPTTRAHEDGSAAGGRAAAAAAARVSAAAAHVDILHRLGMEAAGERRALIAHLVSARGGDECSSTDELLETPVTQGGDRWGRGVAPVGEALPATRIWTPPTPVTPPSPDAETASTLHRAAALPILFISRAAAVRTLMPPSSGGAHGGGGSAGGGGPAGGVAPTAAAPSAAPPRPARRPPRDSAAAAAVRRGVCPYGGCRRAFVRPADLATHLAVTTAHQVLLCCGRPFTSIAALAAHLWDSRRVGRHECAIGSRGRG